MSIDTNTSEPSDCQDIDARILAHERAIIQLKRKRNSSALISSLPTEILSSIFRFAVFASRPPPADLVFLASVTRVSTQWRAIAVNDASLWTRITSSFGAEWFNAYAARSKNAPVSIEFRADRDTPPSQTDPMLPQLAGLVAQTSRLISLDVTAGPLIVGDLVGRLTSPAPLLESLRIWVDQGEHWGSLEDGLGLILGPTLSQLEAPLLKKLALHNCAIPWSSPLYQHLTCIIITVDEDHNVPFSSHELFEGLKVAGPRLETLGLSFGVDFDEIDTIEGTLALPKLKSLDLGCARYDATLLLPLLHLPSSAHLKLECAWADAEEMEDVCRSLSNSWLSNPLTKPADPSTIKALSIAHDGVDDELAIRGWNKHQVGGFWDTPESFSILSNQDDMHELGFELHTILRTLPLHNLLCLRITYGYAILDPLDNVFAQLPLLESIELFHHISLLELLLVFFFSHPHFSSLPEDTLIPSLPSLKKITIGGMIILQVHVRHLSKVLRTRKALGRPLQKLFLKGYFDPGEKEIATLQLKDDTDLEDVIFDY
ncbi:hypothetical protein BKA70DRAFT_1557045 [Coprinopsis sp. MPI-PUGE-AT-0042]|nr:hypothetical protein BKA70DRAFT_1557045 [Coprinopsis sp. MPI-PUGE-AT-0042]